MTSHTEASAVEQHALAAWLRARGIGAGPVRDAEYLTGGTQNMLLRFTYNESKLVLRRGPRHLRPRSNASILREALILDALKDTTVPHPRLIATSDDGEAVCPGAAFFIMEAVDGFNPMIELRELHRSDGAVRRRMGFAAVEALALLAAVDYKGVGLGSVGRPEGFLERQVGRWMGELATFEAVPGYPGPDIPGVETVADWLEHNRPSSFSPRLSHGDFHLANLLYRPDGPEVAAIIDWEMGTVGAPLLDLGWLLATWPEDDDLGFGGELARAGGLPRRRELVKHYGETASLDLSDITWYEVLACFKLGIILEGTYARAFSGKAPMTVGEDLHGKALALFARARSLM